MTRRDFIRTSGAVMGTLAARNLLGAEAGRGDAAVENRKNVIFVMTDQWRYHAQGFAGLDPVQTPCLDAFAARSFTFHNAIASSPVCCPNRACWMTGRFHQGHGIFKNEETAIKPEQILAGNFKEQGYQTAYIGKWHLSGKHPNSQPVPETERKDFDYWYRAKTHTHFALEYEENGTMVNAGRGWQPGHEVDRAITYMKQVGNNPFFMVLSFGPPHNGVYPGRGERRHTPGTFFHRANAYGYYAPAEFEGPYTGLQEKDVRGNIRPVPVHDGPTEGEMESALGAVPGYFGACSAVDADFGRLLDYLKSSGLEKDTIVAFTSDHGEMLGSHGLMTKGVCFEESIRVPMSIYVPGLAGGDEQRLFNSPDVLPTLMGLAGVHCKHAGLDGVDHSAYLRGDRSVRDPELAYIGYANFRGFRTKRYTYATALQGGSLGGREGLYARNMLKRGTDHLLFDLHNDPLQLQPIQRGDAAHTDALIDDLHAELRTQLAGRGEVLEA